MTSGTVTSATVASGTVAEDRETSVIAGALGALGDPTRRAIFEHLAQCPSAVGELAELLPVTRPAVSQHLKVLKEAGLVEDRRDGARRIYRVDPDGVQGLRDSLDRFWDNALHSFKARVERDTRVAQGKEASGA